MKAIKIIYGSQERATLLVQYLHHPHHHQLHVHYHCIYDYSMIKVILLLCLPFFSFSQIITTFGGGGHTLGDGGLATAALINDPGGIVFDKQGNLYIATGVANRIRKIDTLGIITTIAGTGIGGYSGDNGPATAAQIKFATDIALDSSGNIFFSDGLNCTIRKIDISTGIITTVCGNGVSGYVGDNGPASVAQLYSPDAICFDKSGNLYISENNIHVVRKINTSGIITTYAGTGTNGYNGDGMQATAAKLYYPEGLATDDAGNLYISDQANNRIRKVNAAGIISTFAGNGIGTYTGDGIPATSAQFIPTLIKFDLEQNLFITGNYRVFKIDHSGTFYTVAGTGAAINAGDNGPAIAASLKGPIGIAFDNCNNLYVGNVAAVGDSDRIRKVTFNPYCWPLAVNEVKEPENISIFPTPATDLLHITGIKETTVYTLYEMTGRAVMAGALLPKENEINISNLAMGMYMLQVQYRDGQREIRKIVKA